MAESTETAPEDISSIRTQVSVTSAAEPKDMDRDQGQKQIQDQDQNQVQDQDQNQVQDQGQNQIQDQGQNQVQDQDQNQIQDQDKGGDPTPSREALLAHVRAQPGTAPIKAEYIDFTKVSEKFLARHCRNRVSEDQRRADDLGAGGGGEPPAKRQKVRGQNKRRPRDKRTLPGERPCMQFLKGNECRFGDSCRYSHDIKKLLEGKPPDIGPSCPLFERYGRCSYGVLCRFGGAHIGASLESIVDEEKVKETGGQPTVLNVLTKDLQVKLRKKTFDFKKYDQYMKASKNWKRPSRNKICLSTPTGGDMELEDSKANSNQASGNPDDGSRNAVEADFCASRRPDGRTDPFPACHGSSSEPLSAEGAGNSRSPDDAHGSAIKSDAPSAESEREAQTNLGEAKDEGSKREMSVTTSADLSLERQTDESTPGSRSASNEDLPLTAQEADSNGDAVATVIGDAHWHAGAVTDEDIVGIRMAEKKKLDVDGKLLLAPLTTVGNLPFRAVCKRLGADVTCGEMAMCTNLLQGQMSEWALLKRHPSEDVFGVQLCGAFPDTMTKCAELLNQTIDIDFVDINVGCPIDLVYHKGAGSGLMNRMGKFQEIVRGMSSVLDIPLTVKMRTGLHEGTLVAHKLIPRIYDWGASVVAVHGRTREQRYTKHADWSYLGECARAASPHPFVGNGDILSYEDANFFREQSGVDGLMIARGALIKPWIFTEIKEQRHWDISSRERFDILQDYVNHGLMHWGSDSEGVQRTRRFLLEWLSFLHRYIPAGVMERLPQRINERPPYFMGRDELETLMASANCADWLKLSEMFLGPPPDDFNFLPKHKANSYK